MINRNLDELKIQYESLIPLGAKFRPGTDDTLGCIYEQLGILNTMIGKFELALDNFNRAIEIDVSGNYIPYGFHDYYIFVFRSWAFEASGQYQAAVNDLSCYMLSPNEYELPVYARERRGDNYRKMGQLNKAIDDYSELIEYDNTPYCSPLTVLLEKRSKCYREVGEEEKAQADFEKSAELQQENQGE